MANEDPLSILAELREKAGLTQDEVSQIFYIPRSTMMSWEGGLSKPSGKYRDKFISYLWNKLGLQSSSKPF